MASRDPLVYHGVFRQNEVMAITHLEGNEVHTVADLPEVGQAAPDFTVVTAELGEVSLSDFAGGKLILNIFPSIDTGVCATSVRRFNQEAAALEGTKVLCVSMDLPFALGRFCGAEGIENVTTASAFRSDFADKYGVKMADGPLAGLCARTVIVVDESGKVAYVQLSDEIKKEVDYEAALAAAKA